MTKLFVGMAGVLLALISISVGAAPVNAVAATITPDVQCANGRMARGTCPSGENHVVAGQFQIADMNYQGAFRLPGATYGTSQLQYQNATKIALNTTTGNLLVTGHNTEAGKHLGEFSIPTPLNNTLANLNTATNTQPFANILDSGSITHGGLSVTISGIYEKDNEIIVNFMSFFDTSGTTANTTLVNRNASSISAGAVDGAFNLDGVARSAGWISEIPAEWQAANKLNGTHISGHSSSNNRTINSRHSLGPSAWVFNAADILSPSAPATGASISATAAIDFPYSDGAEKYLGGSPTFGDFANAWTAPGAVFNHISEAGFGFIIPNTATYMVVGYTGGLTNGLSYYYSSATGTPAEENNSNGYYPLAGGALPWREDYTNYYWLFDVNDMVEVVQGSRNPWDVVPYAHGVLDLPLEETVHNNNGSNITGGAYDADTGRLYLVMSKADELSGYPSNTPLILVYTLDGGA